MRSDLDLALYYPVGTGPRSDQASRRHIALPGDELVFPKGGDMEADPDAEMGDPRDLLDGDREVEDDELVYKNSDVYVRPTWAHAEVALAQIKKGKAKGSRAAIWMRSRLQAELFHLGCLIQCHPGKVIFVAILLLTSFSVGLKSAVIHSTVEQLWIEGTVPPPVADNHGERDLLR